MRAGKIPPDILQNLLSKQNIRDQRVALGPKVGEDAALISSGERYLVATTDPITFATDLVGWYMVHINANDIAAMGATPSWLLATLLLPNHTSPKQVEILFDQILDACAKLGITLVGGHTEITPEVSHPIAVGTMLGEVDKQKAVHTSGARPGDSIVLTKSIAIEGTALLAREASVALSNAGIPHKDIARASKILQCPGISIVPEATIACAKVDVHAMHDPTEGGLATGLREIANAANTGVEIYADRIAVLPECGNFCSALSLNPLGLISSGSLIIITPPSDSKTLIQSLNAENIEAQEIGRVTEFETGLKMHSTEGIIDLPTFERDELARWFDD